MAEYFSRRDGIRNVGVAAGILLAQREAVPHLHRRCDEIYIIMSGAGLVHLGRASHQVSAGDQIFVPRGVVHALESGAAALSVICVSTPAFDAADFIVADPESR